MCFGYFIDRIYKEKFPFGSSEYYQESADPGRVCNYEAVKDIALGISSRFKNMRFCS